MSSDTTNLGSGHALRRPLLGLDLETTGIDPFQDRLVSFALYLSQASGQDSHVYGLVDPGIAIPAEATEQHGISSQDLTRPDIWCHSSAVRLIVTQITVSALQRTPVVVFNAPFDLTLLRHQAEVEGLTWPDDLLVLDPLALDRGLKPLRKGSRTLGSLCALYHIELSDAHNALADTAASVQLMRVMAERYPEIGDASVEELMELQRRSHSRWAAATRSRLRSKGSGQSVSPDWPYRARKVE